MRYDRKSNMTFHSNKKKNKRPALDERTPGQMAATAEQAAAAARGAAAAIEAEVIVQAPPNGQGLQRTPENAAGSEFNFGRNEATNEEIQLPAGVTVREKSNRSNVSIPDDNADGIWVEEIVKESFNTTNKDKDKSNAQQRRSNEGTSATANGEANSRSAFTSVFGKRLDIPDLHNTPTAHPDGITTDEESSRLTGEVRKEAERLMTDFVKKQKAIAELMDGVLQGEQGLDPHAIIKKYEAIVRPSTAITPGTRGPTASASAPSTGTCATSSAHLRRS